MVFLTAMLDAVDANKNVVNEYDIINRCAVSTRKIPIEEITELLDDEEDKIMHLVMMSIAAFLVLAGECCVFGFLLFC